MRSPEEFETFLRTQIEPVLADIDRERVALRERRRAARLPIAWKIAAGVAGVCLLAWSGSFELGVSVGLLPWIVDTVRMARVRDTATPRIRAEVLAPLVQFGDPSFRYEPLGSIPRDTFGASGLFAGDAFNHYGGEDLVSGRHGSTRFAFSELTVKNVRRRGKRTQTDVVFRGLFFCADFNKEFRGVTTVLPDRAERRLGAVGRAFQSLASGSDRPLVELEDPEFERAFVVRSSDPTEARYLLSPSLMRRILAFHENTGSQLRLSFVRGRLFVAIPLAQDLFAIDFAARIDAARVRAWLGELLFAVGIVDELDLNTRIWSKAPLAHAAGARS
jgi:hypothetical protein